RRDSVSASAKVTSAGPGSSITLFGGNRTQGQLGQRGPATATRDDGPGVVAKHSMTNTIRDLANRDLDGARRQTIPGGLVGLPTSAGTPADPAAFGLAPLPTIEPVDAPTASTKQVAPSSSPHPVASSRSESNQLVRQPV